MRGYVKQVGGYYFVLMFKSSFMFSRRSNYGFVASKDRSLKFPESI